MDNLSTIAKDISAILKKKLPTIEIIESSSTQGTSVAKVRLNNEIRYLPLIKNPNLTSILIR